MQQFFTQILVQPWALPIVIGLSAFLLGLLIPKKGNTNFLAALFFWPVSLLRDLLDAAHTKRLQYYALLLALLGMEAFFSVRAATVYYDVLNTRMSAVEVDLVSVIVGGAVFLCGFLVASHGVRHASGSMDWGNFGIAALVIVHDIAGTVWLNYGPGANGGGDWASISIIVGMCAFSLVPFALGNRAEKLRPELEAELEQEVNEFTSAATRTIKRRAVDRVLRLANRTDVIHLVRSLPADEFADFKRFVLPIISPGTPFNLEDAPVNDNQYEAKINELSNEIASLKTMLKPEIEHNTEEKESIDKFVAQTGDEAGEKTNEAVTKAGEETDAPTTQKSEQAATKTRDKTGAAKGNTPTLKRARRVIKNNPAIRPADLAKRLEISPSYASQLKTKVLAESLTAATI